MKILATVDTVATNQCSRKKQLFETFSFEISNVNSSYVSESQFACFIDILPRFASGSIYKAGCVTPAIK